MMQSTTTRILRVALFNLITIAALASTPVLAEGAEVEVEEVEGASIEQCLACHRAGNPAAAVPLIAGQNEGYLRVQLRAFRADHREGFPMPAFAVDLDDASINAHAAALAALEWEPPAAQSGSELTLAAGAEALDRHDCASCHGPSFLGADEIPRLAGQNRSYLVRQLNDFAREGRHHPPVGTGARMHHLDAAEAEAIATYLASLRPTRATSGN